MTANVNVAIENGVTIGSTGYITVYRDGEKFREYLTPRRGCYVKYWNGVGPQCIGKQEFGRGGGAHSWPSDDIEECARAVAKRYRMKFYGREAR
jgi:hypothetical protein